MELVLINLKASEDDLILVHQSQKNPGQHPEKKSHQCGPGENSRAFNFPLEKPFHVLAISIE